jgi:hypothetical protein
VAVVAVDDEAAVQIGVPDRPCRVRDQRAEWESQMVIADKFLAPKVQPRRTKVIRFTACGHVSFGHNPDTDGPVVRRTCGVKRRTANDFSPSQTNCHDQETHPRSGEARRGRKESALDNGIYSSVLWRSDHSVILLPYRNESDTFHFVELETYTGLQKPLESLDRRMGNHLRALKLSLGITWLTSGEFVREASLHFPPECSLSPEGNWLLASEPSPSCQIGDSR